MKRQSSGSLRPLFCAVLTALMMAALLVSPPATAEEPATGPFVVHNNSYEGGWYLASDGTKQWLRPDCRNELENKGATFSVTSFMSFGSLPQASPAMDCAGIATDAGLGGAYAVTHNDTYNAGWVIDSGSRWWVNATCRAELEAGGVMFSQKPFSMIASTPLTGSTNSKNPASPTCADLAALFAGDAATPLPTAGPEDPPVDLDGRYSTNMLGTEVSFTAAPGSLAVVRAPNSLIIIDTVNAQTPSTEAILLLRLSAFADLDQAIDQPFPGPAYGGPNGFPFAGGNNIDDWLNNLPEVQVSNRTSTTISGYATTVMDLTIDANGRNGLGEIGCGPGSSACFGFATSPSPAVSSLVVRSSEHYRVAIIDQGTNDPILIFAPAAPGNAAFLAGVDDFIASLDIGTAAPSIDLSQPNFWEAGISGPVPAGSINLPSLGGTSFTSSIDLVVLQNGSQSFASLLDQATADQSLAIFAPTGIENGPPITTAAEFYANTSGCNYVPAPDVTILGRTVQGFTQTTPEGCEIVSLAPPGQPPVLDELVFAPPSALSITYAFDTPIGVVVVSWSADSLAAIPGASAMFNEFINSLNMANVPVVEAPPWEVGLPGLAPAGTHRVNAIGGVEISVNQATFLEPFGHGLAAFNETGPGVSFMDVVGSATPADAPFTTVAGIVSHIQSIPEITLTAAPDSNLFGVPATVYNFEAVSADPGAPFVPVWFHDGEGEFGLPPQGRLWLAETERGLIALTAEAFDDAELAGSLDLAEQIRSSATFITGLPDPVEQGWLGIEEEPPPVTLVVLAIDPALETPLMVDDIILAINGNPILLQPEPGPGVLTVDRGGSIIDLDVVISEGDPLAGIAVEFIFPDGPPPDEILILDVFPGGPADLAGIVAGDYLVTINGNVWYEVGPRVVGDIYEVGVRRGADMLTFQLTAVPFPAEAPPGEDPSMSSLEHSKKYLVGVAG